MGLSQVFFQNATLRDAKSLFVGRGQSLSHSREASGCGRPIAVEDQISRSSRNRPALQNRASHHFNSLKSYRKAEDRYG